MQLQIMHLVYLGKIKKKLGNSVLVPTNAATPTRLYASATTDKEDIDFSIKERGSSSTTSKTKATGSSLIREAISNRELPQEI